MAGRLRAEKDGAIGWIVLDNPGRLNAITGDMWRGFPGAMAQFDADPEVRVVILRGEGEKAFAAGADISEFEEARAAAGQVSEYDTLLPCAARSAGFGQARDRDDPWLLHGRRRGDFAGLRSALLR